MYLSEQESIFIQFYIRRSANYAHANISEISKAFDMIQRTIVGGLTMVFGEVSWSFHHVVGWQNQKMEKSNNTQKENQIKLTALLNNFAFSGKSRIWVKAGWITRHSQGLACGQAHSACEFPRAVRAPPPNFSSNLRRWACSQATQGMKNWNNSSSVLWSCVKLAC